MTYAVPKSYTVAATAIQVTNADTERDSITIANVSAETKYFSTQPDVATSGLAQGVPIYANSKIILDAGSGSDPTLAYYVIGTVTGGNVIVFEEKTPPRGNKTNRILADINGTLKSLVALLMKGR